MEISFLSYFLASVVAALGLPGGYLLGWIAKGELKDLVQYIKIAGFSPFGLDQKIVYPLLAVLFFLSVKLSFALIGALIVIYGLIAGTFLFSQKAGIVRLITTIILFCVIANLTYLIMALF